MRTGAATFLYFAIVFGAGFVLGPIRVLALEPRLGNAVAVLCEVPFLLLSMWLAAQFAPRRLGIEPDIGAMLAMGLGACALVAAAEIGVGLLVRGVAWGDQLAIFATAGGQIYLVFVGIFALMPTLANALGPRARN